MGDTRRGGVGGRSLFRGKEGRSSSKDFDLGRRTLDVLYIPGVLCGMEHPLNSIKFGCDSHLIML